MDIQEEIPIQKFNKKDYMRKYMKDYLKEYYKTHEKKKYNEKSEHCMICNKYFSKSSFINHKKSLKHNHKVLLNQVSINNLLDNK